MRAVALTACIFFAAVSGVAAADPGGAWQAESGKAGDELLSVPSEVALASLMALSDGHISGIADLLHTLALSESAKSAQWRRIKAPLEEVANRTVPALVWFALPDGSYWSVQDGKEAGNLTTREYFPKVLGGQTVTGELVVSRATGKPVAIVAVPVFGADGQPVGVLGASVYLDKLSALLKREMSIQPPMVFFSIDATSTVALSWDPELIFMHPEPSVEPGLANAVEQILRQKSGTIRYRFRGKERTVVFRRSPATGWWYVFGFREP